MTSNHPSSPEISVNIHKNARLTAAGRVLVVRRVVFEGQQAPEVGHSMGVSTRTVWKWVGRYRQGGWTALEDRSSRPHRSPRRLSGRRTRQVERLRRKRWTAPRIARYLAMALSTVGLVLRRLGLGRLRCLDPKPAIIRYERQRPGELLHLDTKKLGVVDGVGHRIHGKRRTRKRGKGWEFLHVCVDDNSRVVYQEVLQDEKGVTVTAFLERAVRWFESLGIAVEDVMTDNGSGYVSKAFRSKVEDLGARHIRTRPYTPRTNGKAERFIQTALREWAYAHAFKTSAARTLALGGFTRYYNSERPHTALGHQPPLSRLAG